MRRAAGALLAVLLCMTGAGAEDLASLHVVRVLDGDTLLVDVPGVPAVFGSHLRVRLAGIDAPELHGACAAEIALAERARTYLTALVAAFTPTTSVVLAHVTRDKYFRVDGVLLANGVNVNQLLLARGYAVPYSGHGPKHAWCTLAP